MKAARLFGRGASLAAGIAFAVSAAPRAGTASPRVGETTHGFAVESVRELPDVPGRMWRMRHAASGAELVWLERPDENRTFAIAFRTLPEDDTGVAHVMEHSVLCGSERYPVREPFVELLKSSLATYINAYTGADRTVYPFATRDPRDYLNLADVYLDAALHPLSLRDDWAMRQQGWHYEYDGTNLTRSGVVYSEMKGVWADPHSVAYRETERMLFPSNAYGRVSGGDPAHIPELTFDAYRAFHGRFYHPSNALVFLDGNVDLDATLALVDARLVGFAPRADRVAIARQPVVAAVRELEYPSADAKDRTLLMDGFVAGSWDDRERLLAMDAIGEALVGSNESPLKKALLDAGLCENVGLGCWTILQPVWFLRFQNVRDGRDAECRRLAREVLRRLCREGLDCGRLAAALDRLEFARREKDVAQRGLMFLDQVLDAWICGGDPAANLSYRDTFAAVRSRLGTGWFERVLAGTLLDNPHRSELTLRPSATLAERRRREEAEELAARRRELGAEGLARVAREAAELKARASRPDRPEDLAKVPRLRPGDLPKEGASPKWRVTSVGGTPVVRPEVPTDGIVYLDLCFSLDGLTDGELLEAPTLAAALGNLATRERTALDLRRELDAKLGAFWVSARAFETGPRIVAHVSALGSRRDDALRLAKEILLETSFAETGAVARLRAQARDDWRRAISSSRGRDLSVSAALAGLSERRRASDLFGGVAQLRHALGGEESDLGALAAKVFTRERLAVGVTGEAPEAWLREVVAAWPAGDASSRRPESPVAGARTDLGCASEGTVGYAAAAARLPAGTAFDGSQFVAAQLVSLEWLWPEVRLKGGAYGGRLSVSAEGLMWFSSWRDPDPARTYGAFARSGEWLADYLAKGGEFGNCQIAAVKATEPHLSPRSVADYALELHFNGRDPAFLPRMRHEILGTTRERLAAFARALSSVGSGEWSRCAFAPSGLLSPCRFADGDSPLAVPAPN